MSKPDTAILECRESTLTSPQDRDLFFGPLTFTVHGGEILLIEVSAHEDRLPLFDMAQGLLLPDTGSVLFLGREWSDRGPDEASRDRARIGRVFETGGWVSNLTVLENVMLATRHHTDERDAVIQKKANDLARRLGLASVPACRPDTLPHADLFTSSWVRAFMLEGDLVLWTHRQGAVGKEVLAPVLELLQAAAGRGQALVGMTNDSTLKEYPQLRGARCGVLREDRTFEEVEAHNAATV